MSTRRAAKGGWVDGDPDLPRGPNGRVLCRRCATEVPPGRRRTFCSQQCVDEHIVRTSPSRARRLVALRDRGVCALCGLDTEYLRCTAEWLAWLAWRRWSFTRDCTGSYMLDWDGRDAAELRGDQRAAEALERLAREFFGRVGHGQPRRWSRPSILTAHLWEMDHIVPVVEGGGECGLDGLRTLCLPCHRAETAALRRRLAARRQNGVRAGFIDRQPGLQLPLVEVA